MGFYNIKVIWKDFDYSAFLGPQKTSYDWYSTVLSNHTSAFDPILMGYLYSARMVSKASLKSVPFIGWCASLVETIFVDRGSGHESKEWVI